MIPYARQSISKEDIQAVIDVLESDYLTQGPVVPLFESSVADYVSAKYAVAVNSGTSALHVACLALALKKGDRLWTTPITFVASANCGLYCGATIDFVDIDPDSFNMSVQALELKLYQAAQEGTLPKVVVVVHFSGLSCDMKAIAKLATQYGFKVIEDASHAIGGRYQSELIGNCRYSDITVFSFHPVKIITTGEGGMAVTQNIDLAEKMRSLRSHGITRDINKMTNAPDGDWYYQQLELGFNYRMTELQAALGLSQLKKITDYIQQRKKIVMEYAYQLQHLPINSQKGELSESAMHLYVIRLDTKRIKKSHSQIFSHLRGAGIGVNLHYIPVHTQPFYKKMGFKASDFPEAMNYYEEAISLPLYPELSKEQQNKVISILDQELA